ncbi:Ig-like domain repeat protein [Nocardioides sp. TRM66260-LWL]|uniref:Ig-like domain repeat protein n=1 Tax=Nocardioides sp. TRM66260-LWL TaxID=2874478 RepID=UPI001CC63D06|nr:Ig-like domain repeat protein [Nocardioides sp. TRM66260-LWL]MBZ5734729.1 Ig-like domain repeat protein [Nocardioides sp. TRM66260-LWL]
MNLSQRSRLAAATAALSVVGVALPVAFAVPASAASVGKIFVTPNPGTQDDFLTMETDAPCPSGTEAIKAKLTGPGIADNGSNNIVGNTDYTILDTNADGGFTVTSARTMKAFFQRLSITPQDADYGVTIICQTSDGATVFGTENGTIHITPGSGGFAFSQASQAAATTTELSVSPSSPVASGTTTTLTATVTPSNAAGTVQFKRGATSLGAPVAVKNGTATFAIAIASGQGDLVAVFTPDNANAYAASTSSAKAYTVVDAPTVTGTAAVGETLTCGTGTAGTKQFQWLVDGAPAAGFTSATAKVPAAWLSKPVRCKVTTSADGGSLEQLSNTVTVALGAALKPTTKPSISGTAKVGKTLTCKPGAWSPKATSYAYQWLKAGKKIAGATKATYKVAKADKGKALTCTVTAKAAGHKDGVATTKAVKVS